MSGRYVQQRSSVDCGIAALAMACDMTYEQVAEGLVTSGAGVIPLSDAMGAEGLNDDLMKDWLRLQGWAWQEIARNVWLRGSAQPRHPWPPSPFATVHICFVEATSGWHYCVLDFDGRVRDPWNAQRTSLSHPDYMRVGSVIGLFKVSRKLDSCAPALTKGSAS